MDRAEVKQRVIAIARDLHVLAASSYGPTGRVKVLQPNEDSPDAVEVTTVAERICNRIGASECPIANVYLHILKSRVRNHTDGGLLTMLLSSRLQLDAQDGGLSHVPPHLIVQGYHLALEWCLAYLDHPSCPIRASVDWSNTTALFAILRGVVGSKAVATSETSASDGLAPLLVLLVETFVSVLPFLTQHPGESLPIRFVHDAAYASSLQQSRLLRDAVLLDLHHHTATPIAKLLPLANISVLLFGVSIDATDALYSQGEASQGIVMAAVQPDEPASLQTEAALRQLGDAISAMGVRVVLSQKLIPPFLQAYLAGKGVVAIERLGITHMRAVQLLTGATALGDWRPLAIHRFAPHAMGSLVSASVANVNHKAMLLLEGRYSSTSHSRSWPVATLVLAARNEHAYLELVHVVTSCFKRLEALMEAPEALAGAGCAEIHMAAWLRRHADHLVVSDRPASDLYAGDRSVLRKLRTVVRAFADALESVVVALDQGVHGLADEVVQKMRDANRETLDELPETSLYELYGWDALRGDPLRVASVKQRGHSESDSTSSDEEEAEAEEDDSRELVSAWVLDSLAVKRDALTTAVECASALLRVAGVITTSPC